MFHLSLKLPFVKAQNDVSLKPKITFHKSPKWHYVKTQYYFSLKLEDLKRRLVGRVSVKLRVRILLNQRGGWICLAPPHARSTGWVKFCHFFNILKVFGHFWGITEYLAKFGYFYAVGQIFIPSNSQILSKTCAIFYNIDLYILSSELGLNHFKFCLWIQFSSLSCSIPGTSVRSVFASLMRNFTNLARNKR